MACRDPRCPTQSALWPGERALGICAGAAGCRNSDRSGTWAVNVGGHALASSASHDTDDASKSMPSIRAGSSNRGPARRPPSSSGMGCARRTPLTAARKCDGGSEGFRCRAHMSLDLFRPDAVAGRTAIICGRQAGTPVRRRAAIRRGPKARQRRLVAHRAGTQPALPVPCGSVSSGSPT